MERWEKDSLRAGDHAIRNRVNNILDAVDEQHARLARVVEQLDAVRCTATSADGLVEVTVDVAGVLTDVRFAAGALRNEPEKLAASVTQAGRAAARLAHDRHRELLAPVAGAAEHLPDLPDLVPGAPSLREPDEPGDLPRS
ncbi:YbaB/EbfC family nucleoid-associated protein [Nocardia otitidiscaviarum]|uniref:YbaB/EbfC family nucleoid-associated protein n=1 Tax=Nocardia otitidiscaviarum TaxID=1823 RepID=A0A516NGN3_9NOCA|nr:YbaB/EbfC family nucleoid-associated protein [Nocardia otitidiscaviarum]MCP9625440.1 YbaB/EbfC family nucleoid-associated protein [Nocardia otitidiscaviarum]QDP78060.1 YbaB/EbfC family nucleoid-associated protein [Nocardia otitidiscaviarum]